MISHTLTRARARSYRSETEKIKFKKHSAANDERIGFQLVSQPNYHPNRCEACKHTNAQANAKHTQTPKKKPIHTISDYDRLS